MATSTNLDSTMPDVPENILKQPARGKENPAHKLRRKCDLLLEAFAPDHERIPNWIEIVVFVQPLCPLWTTFFLAVFCRNNKKKNMAERSKSGKKEE
ncbi:hypothetical protein CEXT_335841 [Caerostris extrusa]|uniref:Uncharacterized protein n=1 Tax=Caerostris extrusa TaxID=172846 RepID=A0AAV4M435_CAEEX|nr:hypothetical protein CEXT_335841 [Caerostris extrusa]